MCLDRVFIDRNEYFVNLLSACMLQTDITDHFSTCVSIPINVNFKTKGNMFSVIDHDKIKSFYIKKNGLKCTAKTMLMNVLMHLIK